MLSLRQVWNHMFSKHKLQKRIQKEYALLSKSDMFDANYYLSKNQDVAKSGMDSLLHFIKYGWKENRNPSTQFDVASYLDAYPDVRRAGMNPLVHYLRYGKKEGRKLLSSQSTGLRSPEIPVFKFKPCFAASVVSEELFLFSEEIIDRRPDLALEVLGFSSKFNLHLGWHYLLDLIWILERLPLTPPARILDAGGGNGLLQFILASYGHQVVSADAFFRTPPATVDKLFNIKKSGSQEAIKTAYAIYHKQTGKKADELLPHRVAISPGEVEYHCCDLENLEHLETDEFDAVVSVSALEHNPPEKLPPIMAELHRVTKPGAPMLITISVDNPARFDKASHSWLLDQAGVAEAYGLSAAYSTNFLEIKSVRETLENSKYMRRWLAASYYKSGKNGMPWGRWAPTYLPAGIALIAKNGAEICFK